MAIAKELLVRFRGDTKGLEKSSLLAQRSLSRMGAETGKVSTEFERLKNRAQAAERVLDNLRFQGKENSDQFKRVQSRLQEYNKEIGRVESRTTSAANRMRTAFSGMASSFAPLIALFGANAIIKNADDFSLLSARIENATRSSAEFSTAMNGLQTVSAETGTSLQTAVDVFQRLSFSRDEIDATAQEMVQFTNTVSKLGVVSGASTQALQAGLTQLGQGLSSGVLRAEEFNSILENIPAVGQAIAEGFGISVGELRNMVLEGEVLSKDVFDVLLKQSGQVNAEFEAFPKTVGRAFNEMKLEVFNFIGATNEASNATTPLISSIEFATDRLREMRLTAQLIGPAFSLIFNQMRQTINDFLVSFQDLIIRIRVGIEDLSQGLIKFDRLDIGVFDRDFSVNIESAKTQIRNITSQMSKLGEVATETTNKTRETTMSIVENNKVLQDTITRASDTSTEALESNKESIDKVSRALSSIEDSSRDAFSAFVKDVSSGENALDSLKQTALSVLRDVLSAMTSAGGGSGLGGLLSSGLTGLIGGAFGGIGGGAFSSISSFSSRSPVQLAGAAAGGAFGPGFNTGGSFTVRGNNGIDRNTLQLNGQPIANVSKGESVSVGRSGMGENITVNQNINIGAGVQGTVQAEIRRFLPQFKQLSVEAVQSAQSRGKMQTT